jgi:hypothetical protein
MRRMLYLLLVAMLSFTLLAAGCGGDDDDNGGGGGGASTSSSGGGSSSSDTKQVIESCKQSVDQAQGLSSSVKSDLRDLCEKAGSGDEEEARKASQDVCVKIVEETIPSGPARDQAVDACKQSGSQ